MSGGRAKYFLLPWGALQKLIEKYWSRAASVIAYNKIKSKLLPTFRYLAYEGNFVWTGSDVLHSWFESQMQLKVKYYKKTCNVPLATMRSIYHSEKYRIYGWKNHKKLQTFKKVSKKITVFSTSKNLGHVCMTGMIQKIRGKEKPITSYTQQGRRNFRSGGPGH